jgi:hypothetical protein
MEIVKCLIDYESIGLKKGLQYTCIKVKKDKDYVYLYRDDKFVMKCNATEMKEWFIVVA